LKRGVGMGGRMEVGWEAGWRARWGGGGSLPGGGVAGEDFHVFEALEGGVGGKSWVGGGGKGGVWGGGGGLDVGGEKGELDSGGRRGKG